MQKDKRITKLYIDFVVNLTHLLEEGDNYFHEKVELLTKGKYLSKLDILELKIKKASEASEVDEMVDDMKRYHDLTKEARSHGRGIFLQLNSNFIYSFALFESFQSEVIKITCKKNSSPRKVYDNKFLKKAKEEHLKTGNSEYLGMLLDHNKMVENHHIVDNPMKLCRDLLGIKGIDKFEHYWWKYLEARERRNLLVHRGVYYDKKYETTFLNSGIRDKKKAKKFLEEIVSKHSKNVEKRDLSITPTYMVGSFNTLFYMASLTYFACFDLKKQEVKENTEIFPGFQHEVMQLIYKYPPISIVLLDIWKAYFENKANKSWKNVPDYEKMNYLLTLSFINDSLIQKKRKGIKEFNNVVKRVLDTVANERLEHKELIQNHIDSNIHKFIKNTQNLNFTKEDIKTWFIFNKFKENNEFQKFVDSL